MSSSVVASSPPSGEAQFVSAYLSQLQQQPLEYPDHYTPTKIVVRPKTTKPALALSATTLPSTVTIKLKLLKAATSPTITVAHTSTIVAVKQSVATALDLPSGSHIKLLLKGKVLADDKQVCDYEGLMTSKIGSEGGEPAVVNVVASKTAPVDKNEDTGTVANGVDGQAEREKEKDAKYQAKLKQMQNDPALWKDIEKVIKLHAGSGGGDVANGVLKAFKNVLTSL